MDAAVGRAHQPAHAPLQAGSQVLQHDVRGQAQQVSRVLLSAVCCHPVTLITGLDQAVHSTQPAITALGKPITAHGQRSQHLASRSQHMASDHCIATCSPRAWWQCRLALRNPNVLYVPPSMQNETDVKACMHASNRTDRHTGSTDRHFGSQSQSSVTGRLGIGAL